MPYVPILKAKQGELLALRECRAEVLGALVHRECGQALSGILDLRALLDEPASAEPRQRERRGLLVPKART